MKLFLGLLKPIWKLNYPVDNAKQNEISYLVLINFVNETNQLVVDEVFD